MEIILLIIALLIVLNVPILHWVDILIIVGIFAILFAIPLIQLEGRNEKTPIIFKAVCICIGLIIFYVIWTCLFKPHFMDIMSMY